MADEEAPQEIQEYDEALNGISDEDLFEIWQAIREGATTPAQAMGFEADSLNAAEATARAFADAKMWDKAVPVYAFVIRMDPNRCSAWLGLGTCMQSIGRLDLAGFSYNRAVETAAPGDVIPRIYQGECMCRAGYREEGVELLREVLASATETQRNAPYLKRARLIVEARGVLARPTLLGAG